MVRLAAGLLLLAWSAVRPHDYFTWALWDMFFALVGALVSQLLLRATHDRQVEQLF